MKPLVSVAIPCFNNGASLKRAIDSALAQTWPVEVIVVDDGSTDNSLLVASAYGDHINLLRSGHRGATVARNLALQDARGEWLQFLDADDYLEPPKIETQFAEAADFMGEEGGLASVIYSPTWVEEESAAGTKRSVSVIDPQLDLISQWITWQLPQTGGALWRRDALVELGGWRKDQPCCQEHELYLRAIQAGLNFQYTPTPGAVYRIWSEQTLCRKDPRLIVKVKTKLIDNLREWMRAKKAWTPQQEALAGRACFEMARTLAKGDRREAVAYHRERRSAGLIHLSGPAAPASYRAIYRLLGFRGAEQLASALR
jgi:glycosyltransferase involved in cell wall biosynthesis